MLRRVSTTAVAPRAATACAMRTFLFTDAKRRPQLTPEQREKVEIDQSKWPEMFKDWDPANPYKNVPDWIPGMTSWDYFVLGWEVAFIVVFYECCFPSRAAI
jgi:hypothetical protein